MPGIPARPIIRTGPAISPTVNPCSLISNISNAALPITESMKIVNALLLLPTYTSSSHIVSVAFRKCLNMHISQMLLRLPAFPENNPLGEHKVQDKNKHVDGTFRVEAVCLVDPQHGMDKKD